MFRLLEAIFRLNIKEYVYLNAVKWKRSPSFYGIVIYIHSFMFSLKMATKSRNM